ncbi:MAG: fumarylacetoacetate hydrolase family protein [Thermoplasmata archaeon]|nr:MAG: fumarylacetoacetate hydrolase family protein [Thermoplasmata archaeon]
MPYYRFDSSPLRVKIGKIVCLARTYKKHAEEMKSKMPEEPILFLKPATSVIFDRQSIIIPERTKEVHHEVELGVVIGKKGKNILEEKAGDYILGYLLALDITARDIQQKAKLEGLPWTIAKGFDTFCPISNAVPKEMVSDANNLSLNLKVNGRIRQSSNTRNMIYPVEKIVSFVSKIMTLERGDLILTGTPEGVGPINSGDVIEAELGDICSLKVDVA